MEDIETLKDQLKNVRAAIAAIETGAQEYTIANRRVTHADLATLYAREASLKAEISRAESGSIFFAELGRL